MSADSDMILSASVQEYFRNEVSDARSSLGIDFSDGVESYLVNLLSEFTHRDSRPEFGEEPLAMLYKRALDSGDELSRISHLRYLGDEALYLSGFFLAFIQRSIVDLSYYVSMGGGAYGSVGDLVGTRLNGNQHARLYWDMADGFENLVAVLNRIARSSNIANTDNSGLLKLYEQWLNTGCEHSQKALVENGMLTSFSDPDETLQ